MATRSAIVLFSRYVFPIHTHVVDGFSFENIRRMRIHIRSRQHEVWIESFQCEILFDACCNCWSSPVWLCITVWNSSSHTLRFSFGYYTSPCTYTSINRMPVNTRFDLGKIVENPN